MFGLIGKVLEVVFNWHTWVGVVIGAVIGAAALKAALADVIAEGRKAISKVR